MCMADGDRQGIRRVFIGNPRSGQQHADHRMDLVFHRMACADDGFLDQIGRVLRYRQSMPGCDQEHDPARLAKLQRRNRILIDESLFDGRRRRLPPLDG